MICSPHGPSDWLKADEQPLGRRKERNHRMREKCTLSRGVLTFLSRENTSFRIRALSVTYSWITGCVAATHGEKFSWETFRAVLDAEGDLL